MKTYTIYGVYNLKEKEQCEFLGDIYEVSKYLGVTVEGLRTMITKKNKVKHKYEVVKVFGGINNRR